MRFGRRLFVCAASLSIVACFADVGDCRAEGFVAAGRGNLSGDQTSKAYAVSNDGRTVGLSFTAGSSTFRAFRADGLTSTNLGSLGVANSIAYDVNSSGLVVGKSRTASGFDHAFLHNGTVMTDLGTLGGATSYGLGINAAGQVVGYSLNASGQWRAFLYSGAMSDLGALDGGDSYAYGINANSDVVGHSSLAGGAVHAFRYNAGSGMTDLGTLGGSDSYARAINDAGQVAGYSQAADSSMHAFLWSEGGGMVDLGTLGGSASYAHGINAAGQVVGYYLLGGMPRAFYYNGVTMMDLNDTVPPETGWVLERAMDINDSGQIAGFGTINGQVRAFLLTPCSGGGDCNGNGFDDACDLANGVSGDCNLDGVLDVCDITSGTSQDCDANNVPDECLAKSVYFTDFELGTGPEWSSTLLDNSVAAFTQFSGRFGNETQTLSLSLTPGRRYVLTFDLDLIDSWDGAGCSTSGPDFFNVLINGVRRFRESFSAGVSVSCQSYPRVPDVGPGLLGWNATYTDSLYYGISVPFVASSSTALIGFQGEGLQALTDEGWGIDNVRVSEVFADDCDGNGAPDACDLPGDPDCQPNGALDACDVSGLTAYPVSFSQFHNVGIQSINAALPQGNLVMRDVPFTIPTTSFNVWSAGTPSDTNVHAISVNVGRFGVHEVHTLINCLWGQPGPNSYASLEFFGSQGAYFRKDLIGNADIRDYNNGSWTNAINGTSTLIGYQSGIIRLDKQQIDLPADFHDETLSSILFTDAGATTFQRIFVSGVTVKAAKDCNENGLPDDCETDCNGNGLPDDCDILGGMSVDMNTNGIPDECEATEPPNTGHPLPAGDIDPVSPAAPAIGASPVGSPRNRG